MEVLGPFCDITKGRFSDAVRVTQEKWSTQEGVEDGLFSFGDLVGRILSECCIMWDLKHH